MTASSPARSPAGHAAACARVTATRPARVDAPFDLVVTTNAGYPLDRNLTRP